MFSYNESIDFYIESSSPAVYLFLNCYTLSSDLAARHGFGFTTLYYFNPYTGALSGERRALLEDKRVEKIIYKNTGRDAVYAIRISDKINPENSVKFHLTDANGTYDNEYVNEAVIHLAKDEEVILYADVNGGTVTLGFIEEGFCTPLSLECGNNTILGICDEIKTECGIYTFEPKTGGNWVIEATGTGKFYASKNLNDLVTVDKDDSIRSFKVSAKAGEKIYVRGVENREGDDEDRCPTLSVKACLPFEATVCKGEKHSFGDDWEIVGDVTASGEYDYRYIGKDTESNVASGKIKITVRDHETTVNTVKATPSSDGKIEYICKHCNKIVDTKIISRPQAISLKSDSAVYTGKALKPSVTVKDVCGNTIAKSNYTVKYSNNKEIGKATIKLTFIGNSYFGELTKTFSIVPKTTSIKKVKAGSKKLTVSIKKLSKSNATGIEVQVSTDKKFKKSVKKASTKKLSQTEVTIKSLKAGKKYYVRIRTYKTVKGKKYYSDWKTYSKTVKVLK